jgi:hypothetical protein
MYVFAPSVYTLVGDVGFYQHLEIKDGVPPNRRG